jgi:hypothetical protein
VKTLWMMCALSVFLAIPLAGCEVADETAEQACANASCPPGSVIDLSATSSSACGGSAELEEGLLSTSGGIEGSCFSTGDCSYACYPTTKCCGNQTWTLTSYDCSEVCGGCGNDECEAGEDATTCPEDCAASCGNDECEYGEVCSELQCEGEEACQACGADCCPVCGNGECEWPEVPDEDHQNGPGQPSIVCSQDCGGETCAPSCDAPCIDDGCGSVCEICPGGKTCVDGTCKLKTEGPPPNPVETGCVHSGECDAGDHCLDEVCEACPAGCDQKPCNADGCGGCGICPSGPCKDNGQCQ